MTKSNVSGVVLDTDWERYIDYELPLVTSIRKVKHGRRIIDSFTDTYAEAAFIGDIHIGHNDHSFNMFNAYLNFLKDRPYIPIGLMGDFIEYQTLTNFVNNEILSVDEQIDVFVKKMRPFKDRIIFMLWGNHEERIARYTKSNRFLADLAREIGVKDNCYVGEPERGVNILFKVGNNEYGAYAHHSSTGAVINKTIQLRRSGFQTGAALILHGHTHHLGYEQRTFRELTSMGRITKRQWLVSTGCFLKDAGYAEKRSYPLTEVGAPIIRFYADRGKLEFVDVGTDYRAYLEKGGMVFEGDTGPVNLKLSNVVSVPHPVLEQSGRRDGDGKQVRHVLDQGGRSDGAGKQVRSVISP